MQKTVILVLSVLVLFMFTAGVPAKAKIIDVVHLKNGSVIQGTVTVINESIKIETDDGSISIIEMPEVDKIKKIQFVEPKDPLVAVGSGGGTACLSLLSPVPILGAGQIYNGDYLKGLALFLSEAYSIYQISKFSKPLDGIVNVGKRNTFIWWAIGIYVYGIIDAHVESELSSFPDKNSLLDDSGE